MSRIGRIRLKSNGAEIGVVPFERTHFHRSIENAARNIKSTTHALGFFILDKDGTVTTGVSYDSGFTCAQLLGACEYMKGSLTDKVWDD